MPHEVNWAGNYTYQANTIHRPRTIEELQEIVARAPRVRALGTRHTFHDMADSAELVTLLDIEPGIVIDRDAMTATVNAGTRYGNFGQALHEQGFALHNTGSLPHICVGGATATATHGSGDRNANLSSAVQAIELITANGELVHSRRGDPDFPGMVVHLGALGIATRLTFRVEPTYEVCQEVSENLSWEDLAGDFDAIFSSGYSVSIFTYYRERAGVLWIKHRLKPGEEPQPANRWSATPATANRNPMDGWTADTCTEQMMVRGPWHQRLPHFRLDKEPESGEEIQTEYMVDRSRAVEVIEALRAFEPQMREAFLVAEIRSIAADDLWLSTAYGRDTVAFHFSWFPHQDRVNALLPRLEEILAPFDPRPHWGKTFAFTASDLAAKYERMVGFRDLRNRLDPHGKFINPYIERTILG